MGNILGGGSGGGSGGLMQAGSGSFGFGSQTQCCDPVVDPITLLGHFPMLRSPISNAIYGITASRK